ncbi:MAG: ribonuclease HI [Burkholderiales bacterium]|nr:ribonuclease HI [Phycisphaerae bacterium]
MPAKPVEIPKQKEVLIYTDGACDPNPGIGGWAAILIHPETGVKTEITGAELESTNNRMELTAAIEALSRLKQPCDVTLYTDSEYVKNAFTNGWLTAWQKRGWKTADKKPVKNQDLWLKLLKAAEKHRIVWMWIRGHNVDVNNNRCDELAVEARRKMAQTA